MKQQPWSCLSFVNNDEVRIDTGVEKGTTIQSWPFVAFVTLCVRVVVAFIPFVVGDVVIAVLSSIQRNDSDRSSSSDWYEVSYGGVKSGEDALQYVVG